MFKTFKKLEPSNQRASRGVRCQSMGSQVCGYGELGAIYGVLGVWIWGEGHQIWGALEMVNRR